MGYVDRVRQQLRAVFESLGTEMVVHECRECGTTLSATSQACPVCDSERIATYRIS